MASEQTTLSRPVPSVDPFSQGFLHDPYPHHEALREAGPAVWLEQYGIWTMARHEQVRDALTDYETYCSSAGVGLSDFRKEPPWRPPSIILEADPPLHTRTRAVLTRILSPAAIKVLRETFEREAELLVARLVEQREFDGVADLAEAYPLKVFPDAVGISGEGRENLLPYGSMVFNSFGPRNDLFDRAMANAGPVRDWIMSKCSRAALACCRQNSRRSNASWKSKDCSIRRARKHSRNSRNGSELSHPPAARPFAIFSTSSADVLAGSKF